MFVVNAIHRKARRHPPQIKREQVVWDVHISTGEAYERTAAELRQYNESLQGTLPQPMQDQGSQPMCDRPRLVSATNSQPYTERAGQSMYGGMTDQYSASETASTADMSDNESSESGSTADTSDSS